MSILSTVKRILGRKSQIPEPPDDGFRPSTFSEGYGTTVSGDEAGVPYDRLAEEAEMHAEAQQIIGTTRGLPDNGFYASLERPRCESRISKGRRNWRCTLHAGHETERSSTNELIWPFHNNGSGRRSWPA